MIRLFFILSIVSHLTVYGQKTDSLLSLLEGTKGVERASLLNRIGDQEITKNVTQAFERFQEALALYQEAKDTIKEIDTRLKISSTYIRQSKNDIAIRIDSSTLALAKSIRYISGEATAYYNIGRSLISKGLFRESIPNFLKYIEARKAEGKEAQLSNAYNQLGVVHRNLSEYAESKKYYLLGIENTKKYNEPPLLAVLYMNLANTLSITGAYEEALDYHLQSIRIKESLNDKNGLAQSFINTGNIYANLKQYDDAIRYFYKALQLKAYLQNPRFIGTLYNNLSTNYANKYMFDSALVYSKKSLELRKSINDNVGMAQSYVNLGRIYQDINNYEKALENFQASLEIRKGQQSKDDLANIYASMGMLYTRLKNYRLSEEFLLKSLDIYRETQSTSIKDPLYNLTVLYESTGDLDKASAYRSQFINYSDSVVNDEVNSKLVKLQAQFDLEKKETQLKLQTQANKIQELELNDNKRRIAWLSTGLILFAGLLFLFVRGYLDKKKTAKVLMEKNKRIELLIRELHHRVKNNLQIISSVLSLQSSRTNDEKTRAAIREGQSRVNAMALIHQKLYLDENLRGVNIEDYLHSLIINLSDSYGFDPSIVKSEVALQEKNLDVDLAIPLGLIINELVTNAFKYAFDAVSSPELRVSISEIQGKQLQLIVQDNGTGLPVAQSQRASSFGLKLVQTLTKQLNGSMQMKNSNGALFQLNVNLVGHYA